MAPGLIYTPGDEKKKMNGCYFMVLATAAAHAHARQININIGGPDKGKKKLEGARSRIEFGNARFLMAQFLARAARRRDGGSKRRSSSDLGGMGIARVLFTFFSVGRDESLEEEK